MQGTWEKHKAAVGMIDPKTKKYAVSQRLLYALPWAEQCKLAYDPETPQSVIVAIRYSPDASACAATFHRKAVLDGHLKNPFIGVKP